MSDKTVINGNGSNGRTFIRGVETFSAFIGAITGLMAISVVVFKGGQLIQVIEGHENRIKTIEFAATPAAQRHIAADEAREIETQKQLLEIRHAIAAMADVRADVKVLQFKIDSMSRTLEDHIKAKQ